MTPSLCPFNALIRSKSSPFQILKVPSKDPVIILLVLGTHEAHQIPCECALASLCRQENYHVLKSLLEVYCFTISIDSVNKITPRSSFVQKVDFKLAQQCL